VLLKITDAYKIWHNTLPHIPRLIRYSLGEKITSYLLDLIELILIAEYSSKEQKLLVIKKASIKLDLLKFFLQIAFDLRAISSKQLAELTPLLAETGKMLGGWIKHFTKSPSA
jgi:hypothetical protein